MWVYLSRSCLRPSLSSLGCGLPSPSNHVLFCSRSPALKTLNAEAANCQPKTTGSRVKRTNNAWSSETPRNNNKRERAYSSSDLKKLSLDDGYTAKRVETKQKTSQVSRSDQYEFVFGIAPCLLAIMQKRRRIFELFVREGDSSLRTSVLEVCEGAHRHGVPIHRVSKKTIDNMAPGRVHQGVCLKASPLSYVTEESQSFLPSRKVPTMPLWLILECVQDPMNLGAILRSAYFLGVDRVVSSISQSCPLSPVVSKASSGVMEVMEVYGHTNLCDLVQNKKVRGWDVVGTIGAELRESHVTKCSDFTMSKPTLLLIGGEGGGLSQELLTHCPTLLTIPAGRALFPGIESLNVSVAAGILLHSLLFSRCSKPVL